MLEYAAPADPSSPRQWSLEVLERLDWWQFQELICRLMHRAGFWPEVDWVRPDGAAGMTLQSPWRLGKELEAVVQCAPWGGREVGAAAVRHLWEVVKSAQAPRGLSITAGRFSGEAREVARGKPLELVDGRDVLWALQQMAPDERQFYLGMSTVGAWKVPSCPACLLKMEWVEESAVNTTGRKRDLVFNDRRTERGDLVCRSLTVGKRAEVTFLKEVTALRMTVHGRASGNFVVDGSLRITAGGRLSGLVSARSIQLEAGGSLEAEARILSGPALSAVHPLPVQHVWKCPDWPHCAVILPMGVGDAGLGAE